MLYWNLLFLQRIIIMTFTSSSFILSILKICTASESSSSPYLSHFTTIQLRYLIKQSSIWSFILIMSIISISWLDHIIIIVIVHVSIDIIILINCFYHVFICLSEDIFIYHNWILIYSSASSYHRDISVLETLNSLWKYSIILSIFDILSLNFLKVSGSLDKFMSLLSQLLLIFTF